MSRNPRLELGQRVEYQLAAGRRVFGKLVYGPNIFHIKPNEHDWCGVVLEEPVGKNNGTVQGKQYFQCPDNYGIFVRASNLRPVFESRIPSNRSQTSTPATTPKTMTPSTSQTSIAGSMSEMSKSLEKETTPEKTDDVKHMVEKFTNKQTSKVVENIEQTLVHKPIETVVYSPTTSVSSEMIEDLREKVKDLESKLDTIRVRRAQDKEKLKDYERMRIQLDQLQENKRHMSEKVAELSKLKAAAEKEAKEAREEQLRHAEEMKDLHETAELAVIDKEMTENKLEQCLSELEQTKEKLEEVTLDLEIIKSEIEEKGADGAVSSYQLKQLEQQNERLKEALLKLRDISAQDKSDLQLLQKDLEKSQSECQELDKIKDKLTLEVQQYEEQIIDLKEQVDMALGSQEMVEKLTETNLRLEDKMAEMQEALDDEENIRDLNNQLIEAKDEQVMELREELDLAHSKISTQKHEYSALQETLADYESTIIKFRDLVANLRQEIQDLRTQTDTTKSAQIEQKVENFEFKSRLSDRKAFTRAIDMELRRLEVDQCQKHISFLSKFMPDTFFTRGGDHDAIQVLLFLPRIMKKCEIIERQIIEKYNPIDIKDISKQSILESHDQLRQQVFTRQLLFNLLSIQSVLGNYMESLKFSDCELFLRIGALFPEIVVHERTIDYYMDLLKNDKLDETVLIESLEKTLHYFQSLYRIHLADKRSYDHQKLINDFVTILKSASDAIHLDLSIIDSICSEYEILRTVITCVDDIDQFCKKIKRRLSSETKIRLEDETQNEIWDCIAIIGRVITALKLVRVNALQLKKDCDSKQLEVLAKDVGGFKFINDSLQTVMTIICQFSTALQQGDFDETKLPELIETVNPIDLRAQLWKAQTEEIDSLKARIEARESEITELKRALKAKIDESSEMQIRRDLAEKKLSTATKDADERVVRLQNELDQLQKEFKVKEIEREETLNKFNQEINDLYSNQRIMKEKIREYSKSDLMGKIMTSKTTTSESTFITQIRDLRSALKKVIDDNYYLQIKIAERDLRWKPLPKMDKSKPLWLLRAQGKECELDPKQERLIELTKQVNRLQNDVRMSLITETVWDFKQPVKKQMREQALKSLDFISRYEKLEREIRDFVKTYSDGYQTGAHFTSFPAPHISKCLNEKTSKLAAVLSMPSTKAEEISLEVTYEQLRELHRKLL